MAKLTPNDPRVAHHTANIRGQTYHYIVAQPPNGQPAKGTIILIHGFPDLGFGWRNQVPLLAEELGLQVIVPDMLGYGGTDAPEDVSRYSYKNVCADLVEIVDTVGVLPATEDRSFFVGGHDWGGAVAWRMPLWFPERVRAVFSVCTPYFPPSRAPFRDVDEIVKVLPNFGYQRQFSSNAIADFAGPGAKDQIYQFLQALYGARAAGSTDSADSSSGSADSSWYMFDNTKGVALDRLSNDMVPSKLLSAEESAFYVEQYARHGLRGPTNWYRNFRTNWEDERVFVTGANADAGDAPLQIHAPALMVTSTHDVALPEALADGMPRYIPNLTRASVTAGHWALWQATDAVNAHITKFLEPLIAGHKASL